MGEHVSALAKRIAARPRKIHEFDISELFGEAPGGLPSLHIRTLVQREREKAMRDAHQCLKRAEALELAKQEPTLAEDAKIVHELWASSFEDEKASAPAFPSPDWITRNMTAERIGQLSNLVTEARLRESTEPPYDAATLEAFIRVVIQSGGSREGQELLARCDRAYAVELFSGAALEVGRLRARLAAIEAAAEAAAAEAEAADAEEASASVD